MRAVVQRVSRGKVTVDYEIVGQIEHGFVVLLGVADRDTQQDVVWLANKIVKLRAFEDNDGKMNLSLSEVDGAMLVISQFTLLGDCRTGHRPGFIAAARPEKASLLYESFVAEVRASDIRVETGRFQKQMDVELVNNGPVTLLLDSHKDF